MTTKAGVRIVTTGGTFDKTYDPVSECMILRDESAVPGILAKCGVDGIDVEAAMHVDSLDMTDAMRADLLAQVCRIARVVIVHGTSSIVDTARFFIDAGHPGTIVFTGAMIPFSCDPAEASFNLGGAVALASSLDAGVYIYMHGTIFDPRRARKDKGRARIVEEA